MQMSRSSLGRVLQASWVSSAGNCMAWGTQAWGTRFMVVLFSERPAKLQPSLKISAWMLGVCKVRLLPPKLAFNRLHSRSRMRPGREIELRLLTILSSFFIQCRGSWDASMVSL